MKEAARGLLPCIPTPGTMKVQLVDGGTFWACAQRTSACMTTTNITDTFEFSVEFFWMRDETMIPY